MPGNKNNNNNNDKTRNNDERQQQLREERARRRRDAENEDAAPVFGTQRLFADPRRGANAPVDVNVDELFSSPAAVPSSSSVPPAVIITPEQVEEALAIASATALPEDDDDDLLFGDDGGVDVSDAVLSYDSEDQMDVDHGDSVISSSAQASGTRRVHVPPKAGEVVVEDIRDWTAPSQKDGSLPSSVRDIAIQADFGGASIERHRRYLRASRNRQRKRNLAKKRARAGETTPPTPDAVALPPPSLRQSGGSLSTSLPAPAAPAADNSRDREAAPPAKTRKVEEPTKKKELWWQTRKAVRKEKKLASQQTADQVPPSSGVASTPRRKIQLVKTNSTESLRKPEVRPPKNEDLRITLSSRRQSQSRSRSTARASSIKTPSTQELVESIVAGLNASLDRRFRRRSPSPKAHCSHHSSGRRSRFPSGCDEVNYRTFYDDETEEEDDRSRSRSRSRSRGRQRQRQPPPSRGKGKGRGKGRGK